MKANIGRSIKKFKYALAFGVSAALLLSLSHPGEDMSCFHRLIAVIGIVLALAAFLNFVSAFFTLVFGSDEDVEGFTEYYCPSCKRKINLWRIEMDKPFQCPGCGERIHGL